ncbi:MAG TPA: GntR family transcriptional regulator [Bacteroidota bacterium]|nr:GntR family transcriptional regulator [Bacteroidota bacterium]
MVKNSLVKVNLVSGSSVPKYRQIIGAIVELIRARELRPGDRIPSINELCARHGVSQDTVLTAYSELKTRGVITSSVGKGYYVSRLEGNHRIFLLFDKLASYKETLYEAFKGALDGKAVERLYFHYNDPEIFATLVEAASGKYTEYVIMPLAHAKAVESLEHLPRKKVYILDQGRTQLSNRFAGICQNFAGDIYDVLSTVTSAVERYRKLFLIVRSLKSHYGEIARGFKRYCTEHHVRCAVIPSASGHALEAPAAYIVVDDRDLVDLIKRVDVQHLRLGSEIGLLSYNESPLKEVIAGGITTISTDFASMGRSIAEMILSGRHEYKDNPFGMIRRNSFRA